MKGKLKNKSVLIVDDDERNRYALSSYLDMMEMHVFTANDGEAAMNLLRSGKNIDLILLDIMMPVMDGYTLLRHWKSDVRFQNVPFIVYTATYTDPEDEQLALNLGADAFILKPAQPEDFVARVREVQARAAVAVPSSSSPPTVDDPALLREYSATLIRKLEQKTFQLEESNRLLQQDISARELAETALRESEERFRQLAENIDEVFWLSDTEMQAVFYVSPAYEVIWGCSCESLRAAPRSWLASAITTSR